MGEITEMMLDGTLCEGCGGVFPDIMADAEPPGHPRRCERCEPPKRSPGRSAQRRRRRKAAKARLAQQAAGATP